jgi:general secretion pathway protein K
LELLERDAAGGTPIDHSGESWARDLPPVPLDRGAVSGRISDLQGRFNLNRLANPEDAFSRASFERLAQRLGLSPQRVEEIVAFITPGGAGNENAFARASPPMVPVGGALLMREQLGLIPTLSERDLARLSPHVTVLPVAATLNVNTATPEVLASLFDSANAAGLAALVQEAKRQPFASPEAFVEELIKIVPPTELQELPDGFLGIGSTWFEADLDGRVVRRRAVINRLPLPQTPLVAYRLDNWK